MPGTIPDKLLTANQSHQKWTNIELRNTCVALADVVKRVTERPGLYPVDAAYQLRRALELIEPLAPTGTCTPFGSHADPSALPGPDDGDAA